MSTEPTEIPEKIELAPLTPAEQIAKHNAETTSPDAPADVHASEIEGAHETVFAGNADSLGSLNAVLNRLTAEKRKVLQIRRVWAVRLSVDKAIESKADGE